MTQLYTVNPHTKEVINLATAERIQCASLAEMMATKTRLELAAAQPVEMPKQDRARSRRERAAQGVIRNRGGQFQ